MSEIILTDRPALALTPLTKTEAEAIAAMDGVRARYLLTEWMRCLTCYTAGRQDGCRVRSDANGVEITCRCGVRAYRAPTGTTDLQANRANSALTQANVGDVTVVTGEGEVKTVKAVRMEIEDAEICRMYSRVCAALNLNPKFACLHCWDRKPFDGSAMEILCNESQVALRCNCRVIHYTGGTTVH